MRRQAGHTHTSTSGATSPGSPHMRQLRMRLGRLGGSGSVIAASSSDNVESGKRIMGTMVRGW